MKNTNKYVNDLISSITNITNNQNTSLKKDNQLKIFYNIKRLIPLLDRIGRIYTDISTYLNYSDSNKNIFEEYSQINPMLKPFTEEEQNKINSDILSSI